MDLKKFMKLTGNPDQYSARDVADLTLMTDAELSDYQYEIEFDTGNLSDWDHIRAVMTFKDKIYEQQQEIERLNACEESHLCLLDAISQLSNSDELLKKFEQQKREYAAWKEENNALGNTR
ncbi:hypothetical protein MKY20_20140 [Cytobacillus sp. FSL W8-0315]|uniref:hypothetical protein n=1 Tax=Cytobacillus sp. FSL W8-0315 TaxID=2921600 RepID=UPI0030F9E426